MIKSGEIFKTVHDLVRRIPSGQVATYGQLSRYIAGSTPRIVGFALAAVEPGSEIPWQRVINAKGEISPHAGSSGSGRQRELLEHEGIEFDNKGRIDLRRFGWRGPDEKWLMAHNVDFEKLLNG